ncbi:MAG: FixJ family two-component response regulator [Parasphingorhabdus sp.]
MKTRSDMSQTEKQMVYVVDDDASVRNSLCWLLGTESIKTMSFPSAKDFLLEWSRDWHGCITLDVRMPEMNGMQVQEVLNQRNNTLPVIIVTGHADIRMAIQAMKLGAYDFIEKPYSDKDLIRTVRKAMQKDLDTSSRKNEMVEIQDRLAMLTPRESDVMDLVVDGATNRAIAEKLEISVKTVEIHRARVMLKTESETFSDLIRLVVKSEE